MNIILSTKRTHEMKKTGGRDKNINF